MSRARRVVWPVVLLLTILALPSVAVPETLDSATVETRLVLLLQGPEDAVKKRLPPGFELNAYADGPFKGANMGLLFIERLHGSGADGKPLAPAQNRHIAVFIPVKNPAGLATQTVLMLGGWASASSDVPGAYKNYTLASVFRREQATGGSGDAFGTSEDTWTVEGGDRGSVVARLRFDRSMARRVPAGELRAYSAADPAFYRIYRFDAGYELAKGTGVDKLQDAKLSVKAPWLADLFDGSEKLIAVINMPWYIRQAFLP